jgi:hypothetical protein
MTNLKVFGRKAWYNVNILSQHLFGGTEEIYKKTSVRIAGLRAEI